MLKRKNFSTADQSLTPANKHKPASKELIALGKPVLTRYKLRSGAKNFNNYLKEIMGEDYKKLHVIKSVGRVRYN